VLVLGVQRVDPSEEAYFSSHVRGGTSSAQLRDTWRLKQLESTGLAGVRREVYSMAMTTREDGRMDAKKHFSASFGRRAAKEVRERLDSPVHFDAIYTEFLHFPLPYMRPACTSALEMFEEMQQVGLITAATSIVLPNPLVDSDKYSRKIVDDWSNKQKLKGVVRVMEAKDYEWFTICKSAEGVNSKAAHMDVEAEEQVKQYLKQDAPFLRVSFANGI
jgi:hypothetical protein